jgi:hypothetical protein
VAIPNCPKCNNFNAVTDPQVVKAYAGQCTKIEWPYVVNIPRVNGIEGVCEYYEGSAPAMVEQWDLAAIGAAEKKAAAVDTSVTKVELYYDSGTTPGSQYFTDIPKALGLLKELGAAGVAIDLKGKPNPAKVYNAACTGPRADIRGVFGAKGALEEDFGRTVPALLVYGKDPNYPREVFPRSDKELQKLLGPVEALERLVSVSTGAEPAG